MIMTRFKRQIFKDYKFINDYSERINRNFE